MAQMRGVERLSWDGAWPWHWKVVQNTAKCESYLQLHRYLPCFRESEYLETEDSSLLEVDFGQDETLDESVDLGFESFLCEYHIVFHPSYQVPVLSFNIYRPSGTRIAAMECKSFIREFPQDLASFLTQTEHVFEETPFLMLHPCKTTDIMKHFRPGQRKSDALFESKRYFLIWFQIYGAYLGLNLSPTFYTSVLEQIDAAEVQSQKE